MLLRLLTFVSQHFCCYCYTCTCRHTRMYIFLQHSILLAVYDSGGKRTFQQQLENKQKTEHITRMMLLSHCCRRDVSNVSHWNRNREYFALFSCCDFGSLLLLHFCCICFCSFDTLSLLYSLHVWEFLFFFCSYRTSSFLQIMNEYIVQLLFNHIPRQ